MNNGVIPDDTHLTIAKAKSACLKWLDRITSGKINEWDRENIKVECNEGNGRNNNFSELTKMHLRHNRMHSKKTHKEFNNKEYFAHYHDEYDKLSKKWEVMPERI